MRSLQSWYHLSCASPSVCMIWSRLSAMRGIFILSMLSYLFVCINVFWRNEVTLFPMRANMLLAAPSRGSRSHRHASQWQLQIVSQWLQRALCLNPQLHPLKQRRRRVRRECLSLPPWALMLHLATMRRKPAHQVCFAYFHVLLMWLHFDKVYRPSYFCVFWTSCRSGNRALSEGTRSPCTLGQAWWHYSACRWTVGGKKPMLWE